MLTSRNRDVVVAYANGKKQYPNPPGAPPGLYVFPEWISESEEREICNYLMKNKWDEHMSSKRPTQHFGYKYLRNGVLNLHKKVAGDWGVLQKYSDRLEKEFPGVKIGQVLANLYRQDTGIGKHRDNETDLIWGLSLVGDINMVWRRSQNVNGRMEELKYEAVIPRRSLYIMSDDAALIWTHEVPTKKSVIYPEFNSSSPEYRKLKHRLPKETDYVRISITFREITS